MIYKLYILVLTTDGGGTSSSPPTTDLNSSTLAENAEELPFPLVPSDFWIADIGLISILILGFLDSSSEI